MYRALNTGTCSLLRQGTSKALTFVVIIPCWEDSAGWIRLRDSAFLSNHFTLDQKGEGGWDGMTDHLFIWCKSEVCRTTSGIEEGPLPPRRHACNSLVVASTRFFAFFREGWQG